MRRRRRRRRLSLTLIRGVVLRYLQLSRPDSQGPQARPKIRLLERPEMAHPADALQGRALSVAPGCIAPEKAWTPGTPGGLLATQGRFPGV